MNIATINIPMEPVIIRNISDLNGKKYESYKFYIEKGVLSIKQLVASESTGCTIRYVEKPKFVINIKRDLADIIEDINKMCGTKFVTLDRVKFRIHGLSMSFNLQKAMDIGLVSIDALD